MINCHIKNFREINENFCIISKVLGQESQNTKISKFDELMDLLEGMSHGAAYDMLNLALSQIGNAAVIQKY